MPKKPTTDRKPKATNPKKNLTLSARDATHVKGGAADIFTKIGDIKGEGFRRR